MQWRGTSGMRVSLSLRISLRCTLLEAVVKTFHFLQLSFSNVLSTLDILGFLIRCLCSGSCLFSIFKKHNSYICFFLSFFFSQAYGIEGVNSYNYSCPKWLWTSVTLLFEVSMIRNALNGIIASAEPEREEQMRRLAWAFAERSCDFVLHILSCSGPYVRGFVSLQFPPIFWLFYLHMSPVKQICVFEHSVMTNFNCACPDIQRGRDLAFCLKVPLDSLFVWASSEGSGETARMRRLAWTFAARIGDKYQIRLTRSICSW